MKNPLIFIDTNILLDFYRATGRDTKLSILDLIDANHDRIITGEQVEMEYRKNRHVVLLEAIKVLKGPEQSIGQIPAFLREGEAMRQIDRSREAIKEQIDKIKKGLEQAVLEPAKHDPIYQCADRLFKADSAWHLTSLKPVRNRIESLARKRSMLGYPPRKPGETSCGDAVNWEWIICCARESRRDIVIVSRDADYGAILNTQPILNDWLSQEFERRVGDSQQIALMDRLTSAFKAAMIEVSTEQEKEETEIIAERAKVIERTRAPFGLSDLTVADPSLSFTSPYEWSSARGRFIMVPRWEDPEDQRKAGPKD